MPGNHDGVFNFSIVLGILDFRYFYILVQSAIEYVPFKQICIVSYVMLQSTFSF